jgi:hypothetical protein
VIAEAAGTTEVTLRNRYRGLKEVLDDVPTLEDHPTPALHQAPQ